MFLFKSLLLFIISYGLQASTQHYTWLPKIFNGPEYKLELQDLENVAKESSSTLEVLKKLVAKNAELKTTFTLVYESQSLQVASKKDPRIIFFAPNGLFFSIATHAESRNIEIIQFNPQESKFDFHEISFKDGAAKIQKNAKSCFACHSGRPIWESYNTWKGVYGSRDDYFFKDRMNEESLKERGELKQIIEKNQNEFLKAIELDKEDYFLEEYPRNARDLSPLRRNSYLLYHLGYYNLLTFNEQNKNGFSNDLSFLDPPGSFSYGGDYVHALAARTRLLGLSGNPIYSSVRPAGTAPDDLNIPPEMMTTYDQYRRLLYSYEKIHKKSPLAKCLACHAIGNDAKAPVIPFNRVQDFQNLILTTNLGDKILKRIDPRHHGDDLQMPPNEILSVEERESIVEYVKVFTNR